MHKYILHYCMQVIWKWLYNTKAASEPGTLYHLRNRTNRTGVTVHPEKNVKASEDYLSLVLHGHVIAAAKELLSQRSFDEINDLGVTIVDKYVSLPRANDTTVPETSQDGVQLYASEVLSLGLLWYG